MTGQGGSRRAGGLPDFDTVDDILREAARNIVELYRGGWPVSAVANPTVRETWKW